VENAEDCYMGKQLSSVLYSDGSVVYWPRAEDYREETKFYLRYCYVSTIYPCFT